jgi:hypothetical protein
MKLTDGFWVIGLAVQPTAHATRTAAAAVMGIQTGQNKNMATRI